MRQCQYKGCGKLFEPKYNPRQKFCSNECRLNARRLPKLPGYDREAVLKLIEQRHQERCQIRELLRSARAKAKAKERAARRCQDQDCGKLFKPKYNPKQKYCSNECRLHALRRSAPQGPSVTAVTEDKGPSENE